MVSPSPTWGSHLQGRPQPNTPTPTHSAGCQILGHPKLWQPNLLLMRLCLVFRGPRRLVSQILNPGEVLLDSMCMLEHSIPYSSIRVRNHRLFSFKLKGYSMKDIWYVHTRCHKARQAKAAYLSPPLHHPHCMWSAPTNQ